MRARTLMCQPIRVYTSALGCAVVLTSSAYAQGKEWPTYNGNYEAHRFSPLTQITAANVARVRRACSYDTKEALPMQSGPLVINGIMYVTTDTSTYALDARTCALKWRQSKVYSPQQFLKNNRGVAYLDGSLFRGSGDGNVVALDASTGRTVWTTKIADPTRGENVPMAPLAWNGMVFVGNSGGDAVGVVGRMNALDAKTGRVLWTFKTIPDSGDARRGWTNAEQVPPTGGGIWTSLSLDPARGVLYVPAGNPAPDFYPSLRPGPNLYTNSVIALDAKTGRMLSYIQPIKNDYHDWDVSAAATVLTTRQGRSMLSLAGKDGLLHGIALDGNRMTIRYSVPTTTRSNVTAPLVPLRPVRFCPGTQGGSEWNGTAYNPALNLLYAGAVDWCFSVTQVPRDSIRLPLRPDFSGQLGGGFGKGDDKSQWKGWVTAVDADSGTVRWKYRAETPILAAVTATAGGLVLTGDMNGKLLALDARTGALLWSGDAGPALGGGIITYDVNGGQYIAAVSGEISRIWPVAEGATARVTVFTLQQD